MFIGRKSELRVLEKFWLSPGFGFIVLYGRRRLGKTTLINEFTQNKKTVYVTGIENNAATNLKILSGAIADVYPEIPHENAFSSFRTALEYLFRRSGHERVLLVIDEYPYIARADASLASTLQYLIDHYRDSSDLKLILSGSSMSFMEDEVLAYKAPLYGRRTGQIRLEPFEFAESCKFVPGFSDEDKLLTYAMTSGVPAYLTAFRENMSLKDNLEQTFFSAASFLYQEPENLLHQELRETAPYSAVLGALASGAVRFSEIASRANLKSSDVTGYLRRLTELGIVTRRVPWGEDTSRKALYEISDGAFRFWYRFVLPNVATIERGMPQRAYRHSEPYFADFAARTFEKVCTEYLWSLLARDASPVDFPSLGAWWGNDPRARAQAEIDIVGADDRAVLLAECKWWEKNVGVDVLRTLRSRVPLVAAEKRPYLYLFAKRGFTPECQSEAEQDTSVTLVTYADVLRELDSTCVADLRDP